MKKDHTPMTDDQKNSLLYWMDSWFIEVVQWADRYDTARSREDIMPEELIMLSNYFLVAAGHVYYHALEYERDKQKKKEVFEEYRKQVPILAQLRDRRDMLQHGFLSRGWDYTNMRRWILGEDEKVMIERGRRESRKWFALPAGERVINSYLAMETPQYRVQEFEWVDNNNEPVGDVGQWQHKVRDALYQLIQRVQKTDIIP